MAEKICSSCSKKIGIGREKLPLINAEGNELLFCSKCYDSIPKSEKLKMTTLKKKTKGEFNVGYAFGLIGGLAYSDTQNEMIMKPIKRYNLTLRQVNNYAIMNYNKHFLLCDNTLKSGIMSQMGKVLKTEKLDELSRRQYSIGYNELDRKKQKPIIKVWKQEIKLNTKNNKHISNLKKFVEVHGTE